MLIIAIIASVNILSRYSFLLCALFPPFFLFLNFFKTYKKFPHSVISIASSLPFPIQSLQKAYLFKALAKSISIQRAFSPFLSWPVNLFINCSAL